MRLKTIIGRYQRKSRGYSARTCELRAVIRKKEEEIRSVERQLLKIPYPYWKDEIIVPIAKEIVMKHLRNYEYEVMGTFGLSCLVHVYFYRKGAKDRSDERNHLRITFVPLNLMGTGKSVLGVKDYSKELDTFAKGTVGEMNGMNYPNIELSNDMTIRELFNAYLKKQLKGRKKQ